VRTDCVISRQDFEASVRKAKRERMGYLASFSMDEYRAQCEWAIYINDCPRFGFLTEQDAEEYLVSWREQGEPPVPATATIQRWRATTAGQTGGCAMVTEHDSEMQ
jgi:hypothetical protein